MPGDHGGAGHAMRERFTERFIKADRQSRVRFDPPINVGDWARAITRGADLLSDRDANAGSVAAAFLWPSIMAPNWSMHRGHVRCTGWGMAVGDA